MNAKIGMFLMTKKGYEVLLGLKNAGYSANIVMVVVGRDGAVQYDYANDIISFCIENGIPHQERSAAITVQLDYCVMISWRWMMEIKDVKILVLHDSLLPKYRGFSPLVNSLINGEQRIGVTALFASGDFDGGDIIAQRSQEITYPITIAQAIDLITVLYVQLVLDIFETIISSRLLTATAQDETQATYSLWREEEDYLINWNNDASRVLRTINALSFPFQGAMTYVGSTKISIAAAEIVKDVIIENRDVGKCLFKKGNHPVIVCGKGLLKITEAYLVETGELYQFDKFRIRLSSRAAC